MHIRFLTIQVNGDVKTVCSMRDIRDAFGIEPIRIREWLKKLIHPV